MRDSLFLCHRLPFPPNKGDKIRSFAILKHLARRGRVRVGCFVDEAQDRRYRNDVEKLAGGDCYFEDITSATKIRRSVLAMLSGRSITETCFYSPVMQSWVDQILADSGCLDVVVFGSAMATYIERSRFRSCTRAVLDLVDVDSDKWRQYAQKAQPPMKWIYAREARKLEELECRSARVFSKIFLCSAFEANTFRTLVPECAPKVGYFCNGVGADFTDAPALLNPFPSQQVPLVMTGRMDYWPNSQGAIWFVNHVMPEILKAIPNAHVYLVGAGAPKALQRVASEHVTVTGTVSDIRPYIQHAAAIIAPLLIARGIQNKVLEAMAMAKPIVATQEATRALDVEAGWHLWIENDPARFGAAVVEAAVGPERTAMAKRALAFVEERHNWDMTLVSMSLAMDDLRNGSPVDDKVRCQRIESGTASDGAAPARVYP